MLDFDTPGTFFLAVGYVIGAAFSLFGFALPRMGESYEALRRSRDRRHEKVTPTAKDDEWVRYCARDYLWSIVGGLLLVVFWPVVGVGWLLVATARLIREAI